MQRLSINTTVFLCAVAGAVYLISLGSRPHPVTARSPQCDVSSDPLHEVAGRPRACERLPELPDTDRAEPSVSEPSAANGRIEPKLEDDAGRLGKPSLASDEFAGTEQESTSVARNTPPAVAPTTHLHAEMPAAKGNEKAARAARNEGPPEVVPGPQADPAEAAGAAPTYTRLQLLPIGLPPQVAVRTEQMSREAIGLADRGALYASRQQFLRIMRVTCQSLDAQIGRSVHSTALVRGLRALEEADDFSLTADSPAADVHLKGFIAGHRTPILKDADHSRLTALTAMQQYYKYAHEQLALAGNDEPISSDALYSLGRIEALLSEQEPTASQGGPKALALYHAALTVYPNNAQAANELGVMLARRGRWRESYRALMKANEVAPTAASLTNLAKVEQQLGNAMGARYAAQQAIQLREVESQQPSGRPGGIQWVDNATFNRTGSSDVGEEAYPVHQQASHQGPAEDRSAGLRNASRSQEPYEAWDF